MNSFIDEIYNLALGDSVFENCRLMKANDFEKIDFPVNKPVVSFGSEKYDRMNFLLGYDIVESADEKAVITVVTDEKKGGAFCEELAKNICIRLIELDEGKNIISVAVDRCVFDKNIFAYKIKITFGLREIALKIGEG